MAERIPRRSARARATPTEPSIEEQARTAIDSLRSLANPATRAGLARYTIPVDNALGVKMADIQALAKRIGRNHELALALWDTGIYEARLMASYVDDPALVTAVQMDRWCRDFDNWAVCDTLCFALFDRTSHAWRKVRQWATRRGEFEKRAAFALLAGVALHDKQCDDAPFLDALPLVASAAGDGRNFVRKGVSWALRSIGRRTAALHAAATTLAERLAASADAVERWIGKDALRDLTRAAVTARVARKAAQEPEGTRGRRVQGR
jgi:3-methyladenine DNA glycosylase AlkD